MVVKLGLLKQGKARITAVEMKYMIRTAGYTCTDYETNTQITKELKITPILDKLPEYKRTGHNMEIECLVIEYPG